MQKLIVISYVIATALLLGFSVSNQTTTALGSPSNSNIAALPLDATTLTITEDKTSEIQKIIALIISEDTTEVNRLLLTEELANILRENSTAQVSALWEEENEDLQITISRTEIDEADDLTEEGEIEEDSSDDGGDGGGVGGEGGTPDIEVENPPDTQLPENPTPPNPNEGGDGEDDNPPPLPFTGNQREEPDIIQQPNEPQPDINDSGCMTAFGPDKGYCHPEPLPPPIIQDYCSDNPAMRSADFDEECT